MKPLAHVLLGGAAAVSLAPLLGRDAAVFGVAAVAIDVDHYFDFLYFNRLSDWSARRMLAFHAELWNRRHRDDLMGLSIFHTAEWLALLAAVAYLTGSGSLWAAFGGIGFHISLDVVWLWQHRILNRRAHSVVEYIVRRRRMLRAGMNPATPFHEALAATAPGWGR